MKFILEKLIRDFIITYSAINSTETDWCEPLIAYGDASDPMFDRNQAADPQIYLKPKDFLAEAKTVICYFIPVEESIIESNINNREASREWGVSYIETNRLIQDLNLYVKEYLESLGHRTAIPATFQYNDDGSREGWSNFHAANVTGLGKPGLNNMLITEQGCCGRIGSLITDLALEPTIRIEKEFCLYRYDGSCGACIGKCVNGAISEKTFYHDRCQEARMINSQRLSDIGSPEVCGKCMVKLPCSRKNPVKKKSNK